MTDQPSGSEAATGAAERIAAEGDDVRERIRRAFIDAVRGRKIDLDRLGEVAESMVHGAVEGVKSALPDRQESILREVVEGLGDGLTASAHATRLALEEARSRGETFAREELSKAIDDLRTLPSLLTDVVARVTRHGAATLSDQIRDLGEHADRTSKKVRPPVESAVAEAMKHPVRLAEEAAVAGMKAAPQAADTLLQAMSGLLLGAADVISGRAGRPDEDEDTEPT